MSPKKSKTARTIAAVALASCVVGAGALLAASPATASGGQEWNAFHAISKTSSVTGAPLDGAVFRVEVTNPERYFTSPDGQRHFDLVDPATWSFASASEHPPMTLDEYVEAEIVRHNSSLAANQSTIDALLADVLDPATVAAHEATLAEHQAALDAHTPFAEAIATANQERQALADQILALQEAGEPVPQELAEAHAAAQQAQQDAIAAGQPTADALAATQAATQAANVALDAHDAALAELNSRFPGGWEPWTVDNHGVNTDAIAPELAAWTAAEQIKIDAGLAQQECNESLGLSTEGTFVSGSGASAIYAYDLGVCDGIGYFPIGSYVHSVTETKAPEGYVLDPTRYETTQVSEGEFSFNGGTFSTRESVLPFLNTPAEPPVTPPTEPPVTPPVTPPVAPPVEPPTTPETLAMTGSDSPFGLIAAAGALLAAGAGAFAFRRRRA